MNGINISTLRAKSQRQIRDGGDEDGDLGKFIRSKKGDKRKKNIFFWKGAWLCHEHNNNLTWYLNKKK